VKDGGGRRIAKLVSTQKRILEKKGGEYIRGGRRKSPAVGHLELFTTPSIGGGKSETEGNLWTSTITSHAQIKSRPSHKGVWGKRKGREGRGAVPEYSTFTPTFKKSRRAGEAKSRESLSVPEPELRVGEEKKEYRGGKKKHGHSQTKEKNKRGGQGRGKAEPNLICG